jgi:hypothetical protein
LSESELQDLYSEKNLLWKMINGVCSVGQVLCWTLYKPLKSS